MTISLEGEKEMRENHFIFCSYLTTSAHGSIFYKLKNIVFVHTEEMIWST